MHIKNSLTTSKIVQGVITLMAAVLGTDFFEKCYTPLGEVMDLVALVNCTVNFLLYSLMSRQFRITFRKTFHLREARKGSDASLARDKKGSPSQLPPKAEYSMVSSTSRCCCQSGREKEIPFSIDMLNVDDTATSSSLQRRQKNFGIQ